MPIYDYRCPNCGAEFKDRLVHAFDMAVACDGCGFVMVREFPNRSGAIIVEGFSAENGYSRPDERFKPVAGAPGMKVQVRKGRGWRD